MSAGPDMNADSPRALVEVIEAERLVAIVRIDGAGEAVEAARGLVDGGARVLEFSLAATGALAAITGARRELDSRVVIGAGTVMGVPAAEAAVAAGARYLVSPDLELDLAEWAAQREVLHIPGALTPTEVARAHRTGAPLIKLFPARFLGPGYVRDLLGPLRGLRLIPTGGVDATNIEDFLAAGAAAVAVGGGLAAPGRSRAEIAKQTRAIRRRMATQGEHQ